VHGFNFLNPILLTSWVFTTEIPRCKAQGFMPATSGQKKMPFSEPAAAGKPMKSSTCKSLYLGKPSLLEGGSL